VTWLPAILFAAADAAWRFYGSDISGTTAVEEIESSGRNAPVVLVAALVMLVARSVAAVSVARQVLGKPAPMVPLDNTVLRMVGANVRFSLGVAVLILLASGISIVAFLLAGVRIDMPETAQASVASIIAALLSLSLFAYAAITALRMAFFLSPVVVAEEKGGLKRAHELAIGNLWRMLVVFVVLGAPIVLLVLAGEFAVMRSALGPDFLNRDDTRAVMDQAESAIRAQIVPWEIFNAVVFVLASGLIYSGLAYAYRAVVPEKPPR
jgi:hypothetical protein